MTSDDGNERPTVRSGWDGVGQVGRTVDRQLECVRAITAAADPDLANSPLGTVARDAGREAVALAVDLDARLRTAGEATGLRTGPRAELEVSLAVNRCLRTVSTLATWLIAIPPAPGVGDPAGPGGPGGPGAEGGPGGAGRRASTSDQADSIDLIVQRDLLTRDHDRADDIVDVLADDVTERFRLLLAAWAARDPVALCTGGSARVPIELYVNQLVDAPSTRRGGRADLASRGLIAWTAIAGQIGEGMAWLSAWHALSRPDGHPATAFDAERFETRDNKVVAEP